MVMRNQFFKIFFLKMVMFLNMYIIYYHLWEHLIGYPIPSSFKTYRTVSSIFFKLPNFLMYSVNRIDFSVLQIP